jgi:hypothetical protein
MIDTDPQDGVVTHRSDGYQSPGTAVDLLEPGPNQVFVRIRHGGYKMHVAIFEVDTEIFAEPASFIGTGLPINHGDNGCRIANLGAGNGAELRFCISAPDPPQPGIHGQLGDE